MKERRPSATAPAWGSGRDRGRKFIKLDAKKKAVIFGGTHTIEDEFLYECFKAAGKDKYDEAFKQFLTVGAYAWHEDRLHTFFRRLEDEVEGRLEELKVLYKVRQLNEVNTQKGAAAEREALAALQEFINGRGWPDTVIDLSTVAGELENRKVGDLMVEIGDTAKRVVIEAKLDKGVQLGDPKSTDNRGKSTKSEKSAYGQTLTSLANRGADVGIIFFDASAMSPQITKQVAEANNGIMFLPELPGFVVVVDKARDKWTNLHVAYTLARWIALLEPPVADYRRVELAVKRLIRDLDQLGSLEATLDSARASAAKTITTLDSLSEIVSQVSASATASMEFLSAALAGTPLTDTDWKAFYDEEGA